MSDTVEITLEILSREGFNHKYIDWPRSIRIPGRDEFINYDLCRYKVEAVTFFYTAVPISVDDVTLIVREY